MKRKYLICLLALFVLSSCNKSSSHKGQSKSSSITESSINVTSKVSTSENSPSSAIPSITSAGTPSISSGTTATTSAGAPNSSSQPSPSSTSTPIPVYEFRFSQSELTIDIASSHTASLSVVDTYSSTEDIVWSVPHSNIIRFNNESTKNGESNTIYALNTGDVRLKGEANGKTAYCDIHVISSTIKPTNGTTNISIYTINDYHGAVTNEFSIKHLGTLIKQKVSQNNTLFLDQGDTFQGSLQSNYNRGRLITDVYNAAGMSARTIGNHDFDWGDEKLIACGQADYHGYSTPVLAANVYDFNFSTKEVGTTHQSQIGREYTIFTLESGIKVGLIGVIGDTCETSINTQFVMNYEFVDVSNTICRLSDQLRNEEDCDVVIASIHDGYDSTVAEKITDVSSSSNKKYVDLVLNGHTHQWETEEYNDVTFAQFGDKGGTIGKVNLTFDLSTGSVSSTNVYNLSASSLLSDVSSIDPEIDDIVDYYEDQVDGIKDEVLTSQLDGEFDQYGYMPNLVCKAIYEESINQGFDISYAITNQAREPLSGPIVTYEKLYRSLPFDNVIYIIRVHGSDIRNELNWNYMYRGNNYDALSPLEDDKIYTIACIDYLAFHCNANRYYNYFPNLEVVSYLTKNDEYYVYREITADYLRNQSGVVSTASYSGSLDHFNTGNLSNSISAE